MGAKADEIYRLIPDFGGFLVKANSEGQPGPQTYGRSHADGANMLADALAPHRRHRALACLRLLRRDKEDRAKQAYDEFRPLDGRFRSNVILQVKNGPIDFQPREPFHPLFGRMPHTNVAIEVQLTREYLGAGQRHRLPRADVVGSVGCRYMLAALRHACSRHDQGLSRACRTSGSDRNWTGNHFDQANWYAFGRLAWNPAASPAAIADEWTRMTWGNDPRLVGPVIAMMLSSREAMVDGMTPLGLHSSDGDRPSLWARPLDLRSGRTKLEPTAIITAATHGGIGFDRTAFGSDAVRQYAPEVGAASRT